MPFPSRACDRCKQRRVKCDEAQPACSQCRKTNLVCHGMKTLNGPFFLDENRYAARQVKRPRGPRAGRTSITPKCTRDIPTHESKSNPEIEGRLTTEAFSPQPMTLAISAVLNTPQETQALSYYMHYHVEVSSDWPELVGRWDNHLKYAFDRQSCSEPHTIGLAVSAVSYATFGRAHRRPDALTVARKQYSKAVVNVNRALSNADEATHDDVLLAVMVLGFYENAMIDKALVVPGRDMEAIGARGFAHHEGAMAIMKLRRRLDRRTSRSMELDKLVRRQLIRTLLLRNMAPPSWLRQGLEFGEKPGGALELDHCRVEAAKLRHQTQTLSMARTSLDAAARPSVNEKLHGILAKAQMIDDLLILWANQRPVGDRYNTLTVENNGRADTGGPILGSTVHVYPTIGHAGMWIHYLTVRIIVADITLRLLSQLVKQSDLLVEPQLPTARSRMEGLADDLCASVPYMLGLIQPTGGGLSVTRAPTDSFKATVMASTGAFLCWPLNEAIMVPDVPERHRRYIRDRLIDMSEIVDDGVMARVAEAFFPMRE